ncbi:hypothetical protein [uncultured Draconibacterium sp.]|uniref:hypothetical protein n=1 Tax=uncultured Draconibacterium sp. TaxID=1573823 RepID=UPI003217F708
MRYLSHEIIAICALLDLFLVKIFIMKKVLLIALLNLELWGILGFFATIILSFLSCCFGLSKETFLFSLAVFAAIGVTMTFKSILKK